MTHHTPPAIVLEYYRRSVANPPTQPCNTEIEQTGEMRLSPERGWMPFSAHQTISADATQFAWRAKFKMAPLITGVVEDSYSNGHGILDAKLWSLLPVAHGEGPHVDRSEAQRYLAEIVWCPMALIHNPEIRFASIGENVVRAWIGDELTYVDWLFDPQGDLIGAKTTTRSRDKVVQPWEGRFSAFKEFGGIRAPAKAEVWWEAPEGKFVYWRAQITSLRLAEEPE